ncbi:Uncharacterised protein [BD1-7 clade bacterium]|uniref:Uncharacterized protein n=1 Tax=BD1-7 clade bacterium TaxID=2029982 RepID=A0A5S9QGB3_9GAMM|nr:Uncharacterised protein [BD1-7 clade bacterium]
MGLGPEKAVTALQRPLITILMAFSFVFFMICGIYWEFLLISKFISSAEKDIRGFLILSAMNLLTFGLAWVCYWLTKKGYRQMKQSGVIYHE